AYDFNHAPQNQRALAPGAIHHSISPFIDLSEGFDAYIDARLRSSRKNLKDLDRRRRKIEREIGPLQFNYSDDREESWRTLVAMKNKSFERMKVRSILDVAWVDRALAALRSTSNEHFAGLMTSLFSGDRMIAGQFGMRSKTTWCWWFNSYDYDVKNYAPGMLLILDAAKRAPAESLTKIDFGRGEADYKLVFSTGETPLCEGSIERPASLAGFARRTQKSALAITKRLPLGRFESYPRRAFARLLTSMRLPKSGEASR
ncbi:MAG: GNAT family N-acetyltransferase, partial [Parvularculaceae bacterium]